MRDAAYHERRAAEELACAEAATYAAAKDIHLELAERHADEAWSLREREIGSVRLAWADAPQEPA